ncbi:amino acid adenylation domain-containing protein/thioester reductase-like protein [Streptomyces sp. Amel2xB2]|uniref:non-ribosomal peptide synthetase n=1 Tax=Streptomyces sp. Amel2xB2 TaxID=1305829 RepID=UPI000DBA9DB2|nr:non-ribosomal peptide synthetase [Streptomyces sp. Amel2xB2]RAJ58798.1 amino acid adenylation domain-containing protein/thioester reductase-like protein [Streptomyces sp. Amel2xB2]
MTTVDPATDFTDELARVMTQAQADLADPLSAEQRRWWLLNRMAPGYPGTVASRYRLTGSVDVTAVQRRLTSLSAEQEALRSVFVEVASRPVRLVLPVADLSLRSVDLSGVPDPEAEAAELTAGSAAEPFDVRYGPLLRVTLLRMGAAEWTLFLVAHRLVADAASLDTVAACLAGTARTPQQTLSQTLQAHRESSSADAREAEAAGLGDLLARPAAREIPGPRPRPEVKRHERAVEILEMPYAPSADRLDAQECRDRTVAAWLAVLMRYQAADAAQCGVHVEGASRPAGLVGPLDDIRPVRVDLPDGGDMGELLALARRALDSARTAVPFARLLELRPPARDVSRTPYVQTTLRVADARTPLASESGCALVTRPTEVSSGEHDIDLTVWFQPGLVSLQFDYDTNLYTADDVWSVGSSLMAVLEPLLLGDARATAAVAELPLLAGPDAMVSCGRGDPHPLPDDTLVDLVAARAEDPDCAERIAVRRGAQRLSYRGLWRRAGAIAAALQERGVARGDRVAVCLGRDPDAVAAQLAVLRCGAAFVPVDPHHPADRVHYLVTDSGAGSALVRETDAVPLPAGVTRLRLEEIEDQDRTPAAVPLSPHDAAYVIYTSGSTGHPKGVLVQHRSAVNNICWRRRTWDVGEEDRVLHNHPLSFDPSVWAVYWTLSAGASIVLATEDELDDPAALLRLIRDEGVTVIGGVPSLLGLLVEHPAAGEATKVRLLLSGAEPLEPALVRRAREVWPAQVANLYGPTEATIDATAHVTGPVPGDTVPIGSPIDNVHVHVLDVHLRPLPDMVPGEIMIGGAGVAVGYLGRPAVTAARFLPDPYGDPGARLYRTGDLGRRLPDGQIEFLGRVDDQVKIRGHRVEPHEIEAALADCPQVAAAAVVPLDAGTQDAGLAAAIVRPAGAADDGVSDRQTAAQVREALRERLPAYLVPDTLLVVEELPRTHTGKIDRRRLTTRFRESARHDVPVRTTARTPVEEAVAEDFCRVLGTEDIDVHADFFTSGGTSLMLARLATLLQTRHAVDIPLHEFFRVPTVAGVAEIIETYGRGGLAAVLGRQHAATLEKDGSLDPSIRPDGLPHADWQHPGRILLTGATGYLGLHLLEELLRRTDAEIVCLCRADDEEHARERLRQGFAEYEIDAAHLLHRVRCVVGDLAQDRFGLDRAVWEELAATADVIYHNGALVNFVYPYSALKAPNVGGTQQVLELACTTRLKAVHYVSTIDTLLATHTPRPFPEDGTPLRSAVHVPAGYTGSKWVAEKVVDVARQRGIPVTIFRPGLILGHTRTGATQPTDYLLVAFRGYLPMAVLPDYPRIFDTVPVDYVASSIVHISLDSRAPGGFYHLFNPAPVTLRTFCDWLREYGYRFDIVPFEEGRRRALETGPGHPLYPILPLIRDAEAEPHRALDPQHMDELEPARECANTLRLLEGSGIECPPASRADAFGVMDYLVRTGFLPRPDDASASADTVLETS